MIAAYQETAPGAPALDLYVWILTDRLFWLPTIKLAERKLTGGTAPVFAYLLAWPSPELDGRAKATHSLCTPLVFANPDRDPLTRGRPAAQRLAERMSTEWAWFARHADPGNPATPPWRPYSTDARATMIFDDACRLETDPYATRRRVWSVLPTGEQLMTADVPGSP